MIRRLARRRTHRDESARQPRLDDHAGCRALPARWWFSHAPEAVEAYVVCATCPVRDACLSFALDHPGLLGIWGATTKAERARIRRARTFATT